MVPKHPDANPDGLQNIRCSNCGRFTGLRGIVNDAEIYIRCHACKQFVAVLGKVQEQTLTTEMMTARIKNASTRPLR
jgi:phage FluMu protein Com